MRAPLPAAAAASSVDCAHCGLPVPAARLGDEGPPTCCDGCRIVAAALAASGLSRWYELQRRSGAPARPARATGRGYEEMDEPSFAERHVRPAPGGLATVDLFLEGVHCAACVWLVERLPSVVPGVVSARLDFGRARARLVFDPSRVRLSAAARALDSFGYPAHAWDDGEAGEVRRREDRRLALRLGVAGAAAANAMTLAAATYAGALTDMGRETTRWLEVASLVVSLPSVTWAALPFYRGAVGAVRARMLHVDLPLSLAIVAGFAGSAAHVLRGGGAVYFDSVTAVIFLLLAARWLSRRATRAAERAADLLAALAPRTARLVEGGRVREIPAVALRAGQLAEVRAGDSIPADAVVLEGRSALDVSLLSGHSRPEVVSPGDRVHAGTLNLDARLVVRIDATGEETRLGRLAALVRQAAARRAPVLRLVDRLSGAFVLGVLVLAAVALAAWWPIDRARGVEAALAMLIVTCPCVLAFATPLAVSAALGRAARRGLLVKGGESLEALGRPGIAFLDKTGTLTRGRVELVRWTGSAEARPLVRALERESAHALARALVAGLPAGPAPIAESVRQEIGGGISGRVDGRDVAVGSRRFAAARAELPAWAEAEALHLAEEAVTPVWVVVDGCVVAVAGLGDPLREDALLSVADLRRRGWDVRILSGDEPAVVAAVARALGLPPGSARGGVSPEEKVAAVRAARGAGPVLMVGDGVNDAAALASADVGLAVDGGAEASLAAADAFSTRPGLAPVVELVDGARGLGRALRANAGISIAYNVVGAGLALAGLIGPLAAAVLMPLSSLTVTAVALAWPTFPRGTVR